MQLLTHSSVRQVNDKLEAVQETMDSTSQELENLPNCMRAKQQ